VSTWYWHEMTKGFAGLRGGPPLKGCSYSQVPKILIFIILKIIICLEDTRSTLFSDMQVFLKFLINGFYEATCTIYLATLCTLSPYFSHWVFRSFNEV
jgi:hypothetical protein